jgi:methionine-S-sulfoxide reductase
MGCFWGAERKFWQAPGVHSTSVGYAGGATPHPSYEQVCSGRTGHTEVVMVVFDAAATSLEAMLRVFWENHNPTQGNRQGNDIGTQYRSAIYFSNDAQRAAAEASRELFQRELTAAGYGAITTMCVLNGWILRRRAAFQIHQKYAAGPRHQSSTMFPVCHTLTASNSWSPHLQRTSSHP